ncbi:MAG TPA: excinuclease ABC subunit UvrC [Sedimentisphaerales bacterium]|nr:excinuclease ABC subunit UvrC [Sedimentisphaerales bacterium]
MTISSNKNIERIKERIKEFPIAPGLYFMKDAGDKVLYIGKAKNLRSRVSSYFQASANLAESRGPKIVEMLSKVVSVDFLETETEVEAMLQEARLIKDIRPGYNSDLVDDKTFPYLEITTGDDFPGVYITRKPRQKGTRLFGPFTNVKDLRQSMVVLQKIFKFRTCKLDISENDEKKRFFRPCLLYSIKQCSGPCGDKISREQYRKLVKDFIQFLKSKRSVVIRQLKKKMAEASQLMEYEKAAAYRDRIRLIERLDRRGSPESNVQPEVFVSDPTEALTKLQKIINTDQPVRIIEGIDIAHISGQAMVGSLVKFIDGRPFKNGYRRFKIKTVEGIDDYASIAEVVMRRYKYALKGEEIWPDLVLIDGGVGQLHAAEQAFKSMGASKNVKIASIAKREEKIFLQGCDTSIKLPANSPVRKLLQYIRDEAHRFAQHYHHILTSKNMLNNQS